MSYLRELKDYVKFKKQKDKDIVFYAEDAASFIYFEGVIKVLVEKYRKKISYITSDPHDPLFSSPRESLNVFYIQKLLPFFTLLLNSKVLLMTMPDLHQFHVKRSINTVNHIYLLHNIGSSFPVVRHGALFHYDTIFCTGPHHKEEIITQEQLYDLKKKELIEFGYYRVEKVYQEFLKRKENRQQNNPPKILLAPSWGDKTTFNLCGQQLVRTLLQEGLEVMVRPHPMTRMETPHVLDDLYREFQGNHFFIVEENIKNTESFFNSDVLISDWSGISYEYAFGTEKPVLFMDVPLKVNNPKYKEVGEPVDVKIRRELGEVVKPEDISTIGLVIRKMIKEREAYKKKILEARKKMVYNFGNSSDAGAKYILDCLNAKSTLSWILCFFQDGF